jgi:hypothetical protein
MVARISDAVQALPKNGSVLRLVPVPLMQRESIPYVTDTMYVLLHFWRSFTRYLCLHHWNTL